MSCLLNTLCFSLHARAILRHAPLSDVRVSASTPRTATANKMSRKATMPGSLPPLAAWACTNTSGRALINALSPRDIYAFINALNATVFNALLNVKIDTFVNATTNVTFKDQHVLALH